MNDRPKLTTATPAAVPPNGVAGPLGEADVRATYRVVMESLDAGYDPVQWRLELLKGLGELIDSDLCMSNVMPTDSRHQGGKIPLMVFHSPSPTGAARFRQFCDRMDVPKDPITPAIMSGWDRAQTVLLSGLIDRRTWLRTAYARDVYLAAGVYDMIHSRVPLPRAGLVSVLGLTRRRDQAKFMDRERRIVEIAHGELAARVAVPTGETPPAFAVLPTRQQELATHLRGPMSEKEIAVQMRLSTHTVHNYTKDLYKRLGVNSRTELMHALKARDGRSAMRHEVVLA